MQLWDVARVQLETDGAVVQRVNDEVGGNLLDGVSHHLAH